MKKNEGTVDRTFRGLGGVILAVTGISLGVTSVAGAIITIAAAVLLITALTGNCPMYKIFGISTCKLTNSTNHKSKVEK